AKEKRIEGISDIRDESNREGVRVVVDLKRDASPEVVLNQIWRYTPAQSSFPANMLAIRGGRPEVLNLRDILQSFIHFREEVITRRTKFELNKARERAHILLGLVIAVSNLDEVVRIIRGSSSPAIAREALLQRDWEMGDIAPYIRLVEAIEDDSGHEASASYRLSEIQVRAILDLRLHRLTAMGRDEIGDELQKLATDIEGYLAILGDRVRLYQVMQDELREVRDAYATPRKSEIAPAWDGLEDEDLIERDEMVVTVTLDGYIKRTPLSTFRAQARGGKGRAGMATKEEDAITNLFVTSTHNPVLFFSTAGKVYRMKVWKLPEGGPATRGRPMVNLLPLDKDETIQTVLPLPEDESVWESLNVMFATANGTVRRNSMGSFTNVPSNGKIAMRFDDDSDDYLIGVALLTADDDVLLASRQGKAIRFAADDVREFQSRTSTGVRGMTLKGDDKVISLSVLHKSDLDKREEYLRAAPWKENEAEASLDADTMAKMEADEEFILTVCANGYGKLSSAYEYRRTGRGGQGITNIDNIERNGPVVASFPAHKGEQLILVTDQAKLIRMPLTSLRVIGRGSAGVRLFDVAKGEHVVGAARIDEQEEPENEVEEAIVEEMIARGVPETAPEPMIDRDDAEPTED
ncbi:MAG TPA: DNA gyrase C-terminal beta-propeller domain-containing protein, partial [Croceicoccus sp.]|nr:DNA gyrase C-terminal beta-propeller domain-containing protein [Croceicoccus sp.]